MSSADPFDYPGVQRLSVGYELTTKGRVVYVLPTEQGTWSLFEGSRLAQVLLGQGPDQFETPTDAFDAWLKYMEAW